jgi:hypothetical protein
MERAWKAQMRRVGVDFATRGFDRDLGPTFLMMRYLLDDARSLINTWTRNPRLASSIAEASPPGPAPTTTTDFFAIGPTLAPGNARMWIRATYVKLMKDKRELSMG